MAMHDTIEYVKLLAQWLYACDADYIALVILLELGIPVNHTGFQYLKEAIVLQYEDPLLDLTNEIYQKVAERSREHTSCAMVESAIRGAIHRGWERFGDDLWRKYLPTLPPGKPRAPSNAEVIAGIARIMELWYGCSQAYKRQRDGEVVNSGRE